MMSRGIEIRPMRSEDLREVFLLGRELLAEHASVNAAPWNENKLAEVLASGLDLSFVAVYKKSVTGFIIGILEEGGPGSTAAITWFCSRRFDHKDVEGDLLRAFLEHLLESNFAGIRTAIPASNPELNAFFRKFGFTESKHLLIMENFPPKN
jgi:ribosomal protein S18 acetylase RimI-like enzyme